MAKAYKCDCCGTFYETDMPRILGLYPANSDLLDRYSLKYDVCPECEESFFIWKESRNPDHKSVFEDKEDVNMFDGD